MTMQHCKLPNKVYSQISIHNYQYRRPKENDDLAKRDYFIITCLGHLLWLSCLLPGLKALSLNRAHSRTKVLHSKESLSDSVL